MYNILGLKSEWINFFESQLHLFAEKEDKNNRLHLFMNELDKQYNNTDAIDFINWHIKMTTPIFGEWNYTKYLSNK